MALNEGDLTLRSNQEQQFWEAFFTLQKARIDAFFSEVVSKEEFITSLLAVFVEGMSVKDVIQSSTEVSQKLNEYLTCDLYSAELLGVKYTSKGFAYIFNIVLTVADITDLNGHIISEFEVFLEQSDDHFSVDIERLGAVDDEFWVSMTKEVEAEASFGTIKRAT
jgi:hypothetical protein